MHHLPDVVILSMFNKKYVWNSKIPGDFFTSAKNVPSLRRLHRHSRRPVAKLVCVNALFAGLIILTGVREKKE